ncbi:MAG: hypothetical protein HY875_02960 [Chloroflexi bacterium]|nr:hypothetical protein [Chloroflexota bacterium]
MSRTKKRPARWVRLGTTLAVMFGVLISAPISSLTNTSAHDFANDPDGHLHVAGTVQAWSACGTLLGGAEGAGHQINTDPDPYAYAIDATVTTQGNTPDHRWVHDVGLGGSPLVFDLGSARRNVLLFPSIDHGPIPEEALEATVYGGPTAAGPWTQGNIRVIYDGGFDAGWVSDDFVSLWAFPADYRYIAVVNGGPGAEISDDDAEIDAVCATTDIQPREVNEVIFPGGSVDIRKIVSTMSLPPVFDLCLLQDETGSMGDDIAALAAILPGLVAALDASGVDYATCTLGFRDFAQSTWGDAGDWLYRRHTDVTVGGAGITPASLTVGGGADLPEGYLEALHYIATAHAPIDSNGDLDSTDPEDTAAGLQPTWRPGSQRIVLLATDDECHITGDAGGWPGDAGTASAAATAAALNAAGIVVIGLVPDSASIACVNSLAALTGGSVQDTGASGEDIGEAILAGLAVVPVTVTMESTCTAPITTTFDPASQVVPSGSQAVFTETISVAADAPGGTYVCRDIARVNGEILTDASGQVISEVKTIRVPEGFLTGGGQIDNGNGKNSDLISWGGNVGYLADFSIVGNWNVLFHNVKGTAYDKGHFKSDSFSVLQFGNVCGPASNPPPANANSGRFVATGSFNGVAGYTLEVWFADFGEPGRGNDAIRYQLRDAANAVLYDSWIGGAPAGDFADNDNQCAEGAADVHRHLLDGGNLQIHSGLKD